MGFDKHTEIGEMQVCLLSEGDFESKDGSCFWLLKVSTFHPLGPFASFLIA